MLARHPFLVPVTICVIAAVAEGILAGKGSIKWLATLRQPRIAPPPWIWIVIGAGYYLICFLVLARLLQTDSDNPLRNISIALVLALLVTNASFNYVLFRLRNVFLGFAMLVAYDLIAIALLMSLLLRDKIAALVLAPYLVYLIFANFWGYELWRLNRLTAKDFGTE